MEAKELTKLAVKALEDKKGEDIRVIDIHGVSVLIEGYQTAGWILMDYGDLIVHIFSRDDRLFYDLERIWRDGKVVENVEEL